MEPIKDYITRKKEKVSRVHNWRLVIKQDKGLVEHNTNQILCWIEGLELLKQIEVADENISRILQLYVPVVVRYLGNIECFY